MARPTGAVLVPEATEALRDLGARLKRARLRRNLILGDVAQRIGIHRETLAALERGNPNAAMGTLMGALWVYGLIPGASSLADPEADRVGKALEGGEDRQRARSATVRMSNDF